VSSETGVTTYKTNKQQTNDQKTQYLCHTLEAKT